MPPNFVTPKTPLDHIRDNVEISLFCNDKVKNSLDAFLKIPFDTTPKARSRKVGRFALFRLFVSEWATFGLQPSLRPWLASVRVFNH